jgi:sterol 3beta-glucosyltransferase
MKIAAITFGTEGDVRPLASLCRALIDAGHQAHMLAGADAAGVASAQGVPLTILPGDVKAALRDDDQGSPSARQANSARALAEVVNANAAVWLRATLTVAADCDAIVVSGLAAFIGLSAAEHLHIPAIGAGMIPISPTSAFASPFLKPRTVPRWMNRASHDLVNGLVWRTLARATNQARHECGLPPRRRLWDDHPMLYGMSSCLVPQPADWSANEVICGHWSAPQSAWTPPAELAAFLAAGPAPIYIGFGSMAVPNPERFMTAIVHGVGERRALFFPGWSGIDRPDLPANFLVIGETPHDWLFPRTSVAVHHAGAGTSHAAVRAGTPSVTIPFAGDQRFWADRLRRAGVAPPPLDHRRLRGHDLRHAIAFAEHPAARGHAATLAAEMAQEDGLGAAIAHLERLVVK